MLSLLTDSKERYVWCLCLLLFLFVNVVVLHVTQPRQLSYHVTLVWLLTLLHYVAIFVDRLGKGGVDEIMQHEWFTGAYQFTFLCVC